LLAPGLHERVVIAVADPVAVGCGVLSESSGGDDLAADRRGHVLADDFDCDKPLPHYRSHGSRNGSRRVQIQSDSPRPTWTFSLVRRCAFDSVGPSRISSIYMVGRRSVARIPLALLQLRGRLRSWLLGGTSAGEVSGGAVNLTNHVGSDLLNS
jgi:hypothetical protein